MADCGEVVASGGRIVEAGLPPKISDGQEIWDRVTDLGPHDHTRSTRLSDLSDGTHHRVGAGGRYGSSRTGRKFRCAARC